MDDELHISESFSDGDLFENIKRGNENAFKTLYLRYYQALCNFAYIYTGCIHESEGIVQEVFGHFWEVKNQINPSNNLKAYLFTSVKNKALDKIKKNKVEQEYLEKFALQKTNKTYQKDLKTTEVDFNQRVFEAINSLPKRAKLVYKLSRKEGLTYKEIADLLDISIKTVESQMVRSLKKLRNHLKNTFNSISSDRK